MTIGTNLFATLSTAAFGKMQSQIVDLQERISSGKNDPAPSADPARALKLSALQDQRDRIGRFTENAQSASHRLALTDTALSDVSNIVSRLDELSLRLANVTLTTDAASALRVEAMGLREAMFNLANSKDALGQPLFSGYARTAAFEDGPTGIRYSGDEGRPSLRISDTLNVATGINGKALFGTSDQGIFAAIDDMIAALSPELVSSGTDLARAENSALLSFDLSRTETTVSFRLSGPMGAADVKVPMVADAPQVMISSLNEVFGQTGVSARLAEDGQSILLTANGEFSFSNATRSDDSRRPVLELKPLEGNLAKSGAKALLPLALTPQSIAAAFDRAVETVSVHRAEAGSLATLVDRQMRALEDQSLRLENAAGNLEDLDIAKAVTRLQTLLMTQEASQQTFVRISSTGLFDYIR